MDQRICVFKVDIKIKAPRCFVWANLTGDSPGMLSFCGSKLFEGLSDRWAGQLSANSSEFNFTMAFDIIFDGKALSGVTTA